MMLLRNGDSGLNLPERAFGHSRMEDMKQAMLQHELIFRNQVRELHRLYWTQKNLMDKLRLKALDDRALSCSSWVGMADCKELLEEKNVLSDSSRSLSREVGNSLAYNFGAFEEIKGKSCEYIKINSGILNLNLPSERFFKVAGKDLAYSHPGKENSKGNGVIDVTERRKVGCVLSKLTAEKDPRSSSCVFRCKEVIDLEGSIDLESHEANEVHAGSFKVPGDSCDAILSRKRDVRPLLIDLNASLEDDSPLNLNDPSENVPSPLDFSIVHSGILKHERSSCSSLEASPSIKNLYENRADGLICDGHDSIMTLNTTRENCEFGKRANVQVRAECCANIVEGSSDYSGEHSVSKIHESISSVNLTKQGKENEESPGKLPSAARSSDNKMLDSNITFSISTNLPQTLHIEKVCTHDGSEEEDISSTPAFCQEKSQCHSPSRFFPSGSNCNAMTIDNLHGLQPVAFSNTADSVTTDLNSLKNESSMEKSMTEDCDGVAIVAAAEALMGFTLGWPAIPTEQSKIIEEAETAFDNVSDEPQYSCDSFEYIALQQSEVQIEDCPSMREPLQVNETGNNESGIRLRRGRRLRDFQKEILPGLVSLSRHEICEDLHNIGHKLRRTAARNARENWFVPVKGWRSGRRKR
ncbi:hypothetical protein HPP92_014582 [Vanilla planifolia]|uniref:Uncharacterized protein n=1 Tax=Vanilla planifolia TaxID=51239 RepID=A0A835UX10_VANPL|nr:hypothetical protein HPP92_014582 [Vanilla planifolia]